METDLFDYHLPEELIAHYPTDQRDASRLLVVDRAKTGFQDKQFYQMIDQLHPDDLLVLNDSRVMAARLFGQKASGGKLEFLVEKVQDAQTFQAHIRANKAPKIGQIITIAQCEAMVTAKQDSLYTLCLQDATASIWHLMATEGHMPLPPYIDRCDEPADQSRYQTVYGQRLGSVAAPTAGLHFTQSLLDQIQAQGTEVAYVTLHVGAGTFKPVQTDQIQAHQMHKEAIEVSESVCQKVQATKAKGRRVIAVGTTAVRCLETAAADGQIKPYYGETDIFLYPGKPFHAVDGLVTNFHLPKSTLLMLVSAFAGREKMLAAYQHAIRQRYRFFSYGDAMLIL